MSFTSKPGTPQFAKGFLGDAYGQYDPNSGFRGDAAGGAAGFDFGTAVGGLDTTQLTDNANALGAWGTSAGADAAQAGVNYAGLDMAMGAGLLGQLPDLYNQSQDFLQQGASSLTDMGLATGAATTTMNNVMAPTAYNPMFQNAMDNQIRPSIDASMSARGLGASGQGLLAEAGTNLSNQFAQRQITEQMQAQANVSQIAGARNSAAGTMAQMPGQIAGQFGSVIGGLAGQTNLASGAVQTGISTGVQAGAAPVKAVGDLYDMTRKPLVAGASIAGSQAPNQTVGAQSTIFGIPYGK